MPGAMSLRIHPAPRSASLLLPLLALLCAGCALKGMIQRPPPGIAEAQNRALLEKLNELAESGDWLIIRGFKPIDDQLAAMTQGPLSHVGIFDKEKGVVIEAERIGVHTTPLAAYIAKSYRIVLVRPDWARGGGGAVAVTEAHKLCGRKYDFTGPVGLPIKGRHYCTELVVTVYRNYFRKTDVFEAIIMPMALFAWGRVVWDSGIRDLMATPGEEAK